MRLGCCFLGLQVIIIIYVQIISALHGFQIELEFRSVDFFGGRKTEVPGEKPSEQSRDRARIEPRPGERANHCAIPAPGSPTIL